MNSSHGPHSYFIAIKNSGLQSRFEPLLRQPWFLVAMVLLIALMSTYVHVVNGQVKRGEIFSQNFAQSSQSPKAAAARRLADTPQRPLTTVAMDTSR